jgi:hypothetical protein
VARLKLLNKPSLPLNKPLRLLPALRLLPREPKLVALRLLPSKPLRLPPRPLRLLVKPAKLPNKLLKLNVCKYNQRM